MKTIYGLFLIGVLVLGLVNIPTAEAVEVENFKVKVVLTFEHSGTLTQVKNNYDSIVRPAIVQSGQDFFTDNSVDATGTYFASTDETVFLTGFNSTSGKNVYQLYPKFIAATISTPLSGETIKTNWDMYVGELRQQLVNYLQVNGGTNAESHLHYSWGHANLDELF